MPILIPTEPDPDRDRRILTAVRNLHRGAHWCVDPNRTRALYEADDSDPCPTARALNGGA